MMHNSGYLEEYNLKFCISHYLLVAFFVLTPVHLFATQNLFGLIRSPISVCLHRMFESLRSINVSSLVIINYIIRNTTLSNSQQGSTGLYFQFIM